MNNICLILGEQYTGAFTDAVMEDIYSRVLGPFCSLLYANQKCNWTFYFSGPQLEWFEKYHPEFADCITPIGSPAMTHAKMLREKFGEDIAIVFIGPCIGKKNEADEFKLFDVALTFEELKLWLHDEAIDISSVSVSPDSKFVPKAAYEGTLYPIDGGMNETIRKIGIKKEVQLMDIAGLLPFERALNSLQPEKVDKIIFVEALSCEGGCVAGPCISTEKAGISIVSDVLSRVKEREIIPKLLQANIRLKIS